MPLLPSLQVIVCRSCSGASNQFDGFDWQLQQIIAFQWKLDSSKLPARILFAPQKSTKFLRESPS